MKAPYIKLARFYTNRPGHMTKMAATPIYGENPLKIFKQNRKAGDLEIWYVAYGMLGLARLFK